MTFAVRSLLLVAAFAALPLAGPAHAQANPVAGAASAPSGAASSAAARMPPRACLDVLDRLSQAVPREESGPVLRSKGLRIVTPIVVPEGVITDTRTTSAVRVRLMIDARGRVIPRTAQVQAAEGDPALARAIGDAAETSLTFDTSKAFTVPLQFPFTTVYVNCARP